MQSYVNPRSSRPILFSLFLFVLLVGVTGLVVSASPGAAPLAPSSTAVLYPDFSYVDALYLVPAASPIDTRLRLTPSDPCCLGGAAWYATKQDVQEGFQTTFQFRITDLVGGGGDGFAFVIQNYAEDVVGNAGCGMGYDGITNSLAIEFDTFRNPPFCETVDDPDGNHISVHTGGTGPNSVEHTYSLGQASPAINFSEDELTHTVRIEYVPGTMSVFLDDLISPTLVVSVDLSSELDLDSGKAWVGFVSGAGTSSENHDILNWEFTPASLPNIDATGSGPHAVSQHEYQFPAQVYTDVLDMYETEIWASVHRPADLSGGPYPLIILLHGNHRTCEWVGAGPEPVYSRSDIRPIQYTISGTCEGPDYTVALSHEGYDYLAEPLASWGYIVVSINANRGITAGPPGQTPSYNDDLMILARGRLVLKHLQLWHKWNTVGGAPPELGVGPDDLVGKIDFGNVGLMGHSRGGEGVRAAYNLYRSDPNPALDWSATIPDLVIKAIFEIAPTDFGGDPQSFNSPELEANGTVWNVLLPMCDGDVLGLSGIKPFDRSLRNFAERPATPKSAYIVWGANHNFYNTEWQTSDSMGCSGHTPLFDPSQSASPGQQQTALASVLALFRGNVGTEPDTQYNLNFNPLVPLPSVVSSITRVERNFSVSPNANLTTVFEDFTGPTGENTYGFANDMSNITMTHGLAYRNSPYDTPLGPIHDLSQRVGSIEWATATDTVYFQTNWQAAGSGRDIGSFNTLDFRIAPMSSTLNLPGSTNFSIGLAQADGSLSSPVALNAYTDLDGLFGAQMQISGYPNIILHPILRTVRIPLRDFANVDLTQVRGVRLTFDDTPSGAIYVADIRLSHLTGAAPLATMPKAAEGPLPLAGLPGELPQPTRARRTDAGPLWPTMSITVDVEIELYSPTGFPARAMAPVLRIGNSDFVRSWYKDASGQTLVFGLTADEFAALSDGDVVTLDYGTGDLGRQWFFGPLDKDNLAMEEQLQLNKQSALDRLIALRAVVTDPEEGALLDDAIDQLGESLAPERWMDASRLHYPEGLAVFNTEIEAVNNLEQVIQDPGSETPASALLAIIAGRIVPVDRSLAVVAIGDAFEAGMAQARIDLAADALAQGDSDATAGDFAAAIAHYRDAWHYVMASEYRIMLPIVLKDR